MLAIITGPGVGRIFALGWLPHEVAQPKKELRVEVEGLRTLYMYTTHKTLIVYHPSLDGYNGPRSRHPSLPATLL
jgi:glycine cleavage system aminomethyltransferase T